jgi:hypothetical protein
MKMKCENIVTCGNYNCALNYDGACIRTVVALDNDGKCVMYKPKAKPAESKPKKPFDVEASK